MFNTTTTTTQDESGNRVVPSIGKSHVAWLRATQQLSQSILVNHSAPGRHALQATSTGSSSIVSTQHKYCSYLSGDLIGRRVFTLPDTTSIPQAPTTPKNLDKYCSTISDHGRPIHLIRRAQHNALCTCAECRGGSKCTRGRPAFDDGSGLHPRADGASWIDNGTFLRNNMLGMRCKDHCREPSIRYIYFA